MTYVKEATDLGNWVELHAAESTHVSKIAFESAYDPKDVRDVSDIYLNANETLQRVMRNFMPLVFDGAEVKLMPPEIAVAERARLLVKDAEPDTLPITVLRPLEQHEHIASTAKNRLDLDVFRTFISSGDVPVDFKEKVRPRGSTEYILSPGGLLSIARLKSGQRDHERLTPYTFKTRARDLTKADINRVSTVYQIVQNPLQRDNKAHAVLRVFYQRYAELAAHSPTAVDEAAKSALTAHAIS